MSSSLADSFHKHLNIDSTTALLLRDHTLNMRGNVIPGFHRGSKLLGCPTANIPIDPYTQELQQLTPGIYFGWASIHGFQHSSPDDVYKMVMSIGWNPYFHNKDKTIEAHLLHEFPEDFYGADLRLAIIGYIRPEANFDSLEALKAAIENDIRLTAQALDTDLVSKLLDKSDFLCKASLYSV